MLIAADRFFLSAGNVLIFAIGLCLVVFIGAIDYLTGSEISFSIFYLLPVSLVAWYGRNGSGYLTCVVSGLVWFYLDWRHENVYSNFLIPYWNASVRLGFFLTTAYLLCRLKKQLWREQLFARTDALTGLLNVRIFREIASRLILTSTRYQRCLTMAYIDVDYFKLVNDTMGHSEGDRLLRTVGETLSRCLRETDIIARVGGDEFAVVLPETNSAAAKTVFSNIRTELREKIRHAGWPVDISIGVAIFNVAPKNFDEAISIADQLMYRVKSAGKGRTDFEEFN